MGETLTPIEMECDTDMKRSEKERFVAYEKLTRKKRRELDVARRGTWGTVNPVTRRPEPSTAYQRQKEKRRWRAEPDSSGVFILFRLLRGFQNGFRVSRI